MGIANKPFLDETFLLDNSIAEILYFDYAAPLPIIDYHNHLPPKEIAEDRTFENITQIWLQGDHYKWRAMRTLGIDEKYITGTASDKEKFLKWSETTPHTLRNPLYHWTHLELQRYFDINILLSPDSAEEIYEQTNALLKEDDRYSTQSLITKMKVAVLCTTDDPVDDLQYHQQVSQQNLAFQMLPTWRPDRAMAVENTKAFLSYLKELAQCSDSDIGSLQSYLQALQQRHDYFESMGCKLSDHGLTQIPHATFTRKDAEHCFDLLLSDKDLNPDQANQLRSLLLTEFAKMDHSKGWVQQFHLGAMRNTNSKSLETIGADSGFDSIGDFPQATSLASFLDRLNQTDQLAKTILYNLNPADNEIMATMIGNFNDGSSKGKLQFGSGWWYLDQLDGMEKQLNTLSSVSLLSCFVGMLTDSRSFMSFPRHEYFRRLLCNLLGKEIDAGKIPEDYDLVGDLVKNVCYYNAKNYFNF